MNSAYMGSYEGKNVYGFSMASQVYYGKPFKQLNDDEYLSLVAMLIRPNQFNVLGTPKKIESDYPVLRRLSPESISPQN